MTPNSARPDDESIDLVLRGLGLGLREQAERILGSMPNYYTAYGAIADARAVLDLIETFVKEELKHRDDESDGEVAADEPAGSPEYDCGGLYL